MLGIGLAATRDIVSFFRYAASDGAGAANPVAGDVDARGSDRRLAVGQLHQDVHPPRLQRGSVAAASSGMACFRISLPGKLPINFRFALPGGAATLYEPGSEAVVWWGRYADTARGRPAASLLDRCTRDAARAPKVIETFGSAEFWGLRMSPGLIGTDAKRDIPLPAKFDATTFRGRRMAAAVADSRRRWSGRPARLRAAGEPEPGGRHDACAHPRG